VEMSADVIAVQASMRVRRFILSPFEMNSWMEIGVCAERAEHMSIKFSL